MIVKENIMGIRLSLYKKPTKKPHAQTNSAKITSISDAFEPSPIGEGKCSAMAEK